MEPIEEEKRGGKELKKHAIIWEVQSSSLKNSHFFRRLHTSMFFSDQSMEAHTHNYAYSFPTYYRKKTRICEAEVPFKPEFNASFSQ